MTGEAIFIYGTEVTISTSVSTLVDGAIDSESKTAIVSTYPLVDLVLTGTFAIAPAVGSKVHIYRRDMNIDGVLDAPVPDSNFKSIYVGTFIVSAIATSQSVVLRSVPLSGDCTFHLENEAGQTLNSGWILKGTPKSFNVAA